MVSMLLNGALVLRAFVRFGNFNFDNSTTDPEVIQPPSITPNNDRATTALSGMVEAAASFLPDFGYAVDTVANAFSSESMTSFIWHKGEPFDPNKGEPIAAPSSHTGLTIDALSIGTNYNTKQMIGQLNSWGSHQSIRYMFGSTENDDHDVLCHKNLTKDAMYILSLYCTQESHGGKNSRLKQIRSQYPSFKWLESENKTPGWMCAQSRFARSIGKVGRFYRKKGLNALPDYFLIQDDDTFYDMPNLIQNLKERNADPHTPFVTGGCVVSWPKRMINFSFPYGKLFPSLRLQNVGRLISSLQGGSEQ